MIDTSSTVSFRHTFHRVLCVALIAVWAFRLFQIVPNWIAGTPPTYPGQYMRRLLGSASGISLLGAVLINTSSARHTLRGRLGYWMLMGIALAILFGEVITGV